MIALAISERTKSRLRALELPARATALSAGYVAWIAFFKLLVLTFITYFVLSSSKHAPKFEEVYESFASNELGIMGLAALIFIAIFPRLSPISTPVAGELFSPVRFERQFIPGFAQGAAFAALFILIFVLTGIYRYLGFFVQFEDTAVAVSNMILRTVSLASLIYFEEFFFRRKLLAYFQKWRPVQSLGDACWIAAPLSLLYCVVKMFQFDLGLMHWITLFLLSFLLTLRAIERTEFDEGAGFWLALLLFFHPLLSLPIFGNDISGLLMVKYQPGTTAPTAAAIDTATTTVRLLSGGSGGPLSSLAVQILFLIALIRESLAIRRITGLRSRP